MKNGAAFARYYHHTNITVPSKRATNVVLPRSSTSNFLVQGFVDLRKALACAPASVLCSLRIYRVESAVVSVVSFEIISVVDAFKTGAETKSASVSFLPSLRIVLGMLRLPITEHVTVGSLTSMHISVLELLFVDTAPPLLTNRKLSDLLRACSALMRAAALRRLCASSFHFRLYVGMWYAHSFYFE